MGREVVSAVGVMAEKGLSGEEVTLFNSTGLAIQDAATAKLIYDKALEARIGTEVEL